MVFPKTPWLRRRSWRISPRRNDKLIVKGGAYAGKALDAEGVKALASIPSKEVLLSQLLGLMQSPISRLARVLAAHRRDSVAKARLPMQHPPTRHRPNRPPERRATLDLRNSIQLGNQNGIR